MNETKQRRFGRLGVRSALATLAVTGALVGLTGGVAEASSYYYGSTLTVNASSSMITHSLTVYPSVSVMSGFSSQSVYYAVKSTDVVTGTTKLFGYYGPYTIQPTTTTYSSCNTLNQTGCNSYTQPMTNLPYLNLWGQAGHSYRITTQVVYGTANGWWYGPWTALESCYNQYSANGITSYYWGNNCAT